MRILKNKIILLFIAALAIGCSKDDSVQEKKYLLEKFSSSTNGLELKIVYNEQNLPKELQNYSGGVVQSISYFTYVDNKVDRITYSSGYDKFIYDADGKLQKRNSYSVGPNMGETLNSSYEYVYTSNKTTSIYRDGLNTIVAKREYLYNDSGNVIEEKYYTFDAANPNGVYQNSYFYSNYDDKINLLSALPNVILDGNISKNNARTVNVLNNQSPNNYIFEYNEAGYVTNRSKVGSAETFQYEYLIK